jgi:lipid II isoglutaminyl synthase (glutamine-hydrolysing)
VEKMLLIASLITKIINKTIQITGKGSGYTLPGHVVLKLFPSLLEKFTEFYPKGVVLISGTNGKTTTSKLTTHLLMSYGNKVCHNKSGANLVNGIVTSILLDTSFSGKPLSDFGVFEVDEMALSRVLEFLPPDVVVLLNLSRDQLDRYGEVDIILENWREGLSLLSDGGVVVMDGEQREFRSLVDVFKGSSVFFDPEPTLLRKTRLYGDYNAKNVNAAVKTLEILGYSVETTSVFLENFSSAYGRGELLDYKGKVFQIFLAKNPASFNSNLDHLFSDSTFKSILFFILNDNIPDGRDISWIYDIDAQRLEDVCRGKNVFVSGTRSLDMAVRLKYAGVEVPKDKINSDPEVLLGRMISENSESTIVVMPNYSAMLDLRKSLIGRRIL